MSADFDRRLLLIYSTLWGKLHFMWFLFSNQIFSRHYAYFGFMSYVWCKTFFFFSDDINPRFLMKMYEISVSFNEKSLILKFLQLNDFFFPAEYMSLIINFCGTLPIFLMIDGMMVMSSKKQFNFIRQEK